MKICALPGCNNPSKNWRTHFCCPSHGMKYVHSGLPKLPNIAQTTRIKRSPNGTRNPKSPSYIPYKDKTPEQKGAWVAYVVARQKRIKKATPAWADLDEIKQVYVQAQQQTKETGVPHEVDHIIPIQGKLVSGLHVPSNLQILTEKENQSKNAKFTV